MTDDRIAQLVMFEIELAAAQLRKRMDDATAVAALQWGIAHGVKVAMPAPIIVSVMGA